MTYKDYLKVFIGKSGRMDTNKFGNIISYGKGSASGGFTITEVYDDFIIGVYTGIHSNCNLKWAMPFHLFAIEVDINDGSQGTNISK